MSRIVCQFSCGAASAVATKPILAEYAPERVVILNAFIKEEHEDNRRFLADCEKWFQHPIVVVRDTKWSASTMEIWRQKRYFIGLRRAPCSVELKRSHLNSYCTPGDVLVLGFTIEERDRSENIQDANPANKFLFPLIEKSLSKSDCLAMIERAGIELPEMYRRGFSNANCIGCPKGGQSYWQSIRAEFPQQFIQISELQQTIAAERGDNAYFLRFRSGPRKNERMSLAELPPGRGNMAEEASFSCSFFCEMAEQDIELGKVEGR